MNAPSRVAQTPWRDLSAEISPEIVTAHHFATIAGRDDLVEITGPLVRRVDGPKEHVREGAGCQRYLDWTDAARAELMQFRPGQSWATPYMRDIGNFANVWAYGGSEKLPPEECEREIGRYVRAIFELPGYAPWTGRDLPHSPDTA